MFEKVEIYTDGACKNNGSKSAVGGWGVLIRHMGQTVELCDGERGTTNNRMELTAAIRALEHLSHSSSVKIHTDSQYVQQGICEWMRGWKRKGWVTSTGERVKNEELWRRLDDLCDIHDVEWVWVKGHNGTPGNERADQLANDGIKKVLAK